MLAKHIILLEIAAIVFVGVSGLHSDENTIASWIKLSVPDDANYYNELCRGKTCVPKCCPAGQYLFGYRRKCRPNKKVNQKTFGEVPVYYKNLTETGKYLNEVILVPGRITDQEFNRTAFDFSEFCFYHVTEDGILVQETPNVLHRWAYLNGTNYCVDYLIPIKALGMTEAELRFIVRTESSVAVADDPAVTYGILVSCFFLTLVLIVYALLRELRNLSGRVMMAYVFSLLFGFLLMAIMQLNTHEPKICKGLTYCTYFFLLASFCWMNIMSCDIWWTFRGYAKARPIHRRGELFKFCMYCIYAWGVPAGMTIMMIVLNETNMRHMPWIVTPNIPLKSCFFSAEEKMFYLYIPMLILIMCNWIFFLMTAFNIWRLHRATAVLDSAAAGTPAAHRSQKYRFLVYLKLSVIMGINWVLEVVSSFNPDFKGWYISDIYNVLIGLSIFLIFVCKRQILRKLIKRFQECGGWKQTRLWYSRSRSSNATESDVSTDLPVPVCINPKGPEGFLSKT